MATKEGIPTRLKSAASGAPTAAPTRRARRIAPAAGQPLLIQSTPRSAEARPDMEPTDRSISPRSRTQTMPSEMMPVVAQS